MAKQKFKTPIKDKPLRNPGESLDKQLQELIGGELLSYLIVSGMFVMLAILEWYHWYSKVQPNPWFYTIVAVISVAYSGLKIFFLIKKGRSIKQGRDGEKAVGQYLENLRESGAKVFHDVPGDNFNLDHVVISKSGLYVIETKTYSKPEKGEAKILFNGETVLFNGNNQTNKPIIQVTAASNWLRELIEQSTGQKIMVKPVIVFPGWFIDTTYEAKASDIWVLNPKALPTFISNSKEQLSNEQVKLIAFHLSRYIRTFEDK
jgi:Nuclease-related domain